MKLPALFDALIGLLIGSYQKSELPAKFWFYQLTKKRLGRLLIRHRIDNRKFWVPWDQWCFWLEKGPENYYLDEFIPFTVEINHLPSKSIFLDLGADIGVVSSLVVRRCPNISYVIAVEPNPNSYQNLELNMSQIPIQVSTFKKAVSNFNGFANLVRNSQLGSDHEGHIQSNHEGETAVTTVDTLVKDADIECDSVILKIDVEGQEEQVLQGAENVIRTAKDVLILLEIHPSVLERDGMTAETLFEAAEQHRAFSWTIPALNNQKVDRSKAFYEQVEMRQYDIIGRSI